MIEVHVVEASFRPVDEVKLRAISGVKVYAWLLETIASRDPSEAEGMHREGFKRFSVTPVTLSRDGHYRLRASFVDERRASLLARALVERPTTTMGGQALEVASLKLARLPLGLEGCSPIQRFIIRFLSPTVFRKGPKIDLLLPEPRLVVRAASRLLHELTGLQLNEHLLSELLVVTRYRLRTVKVEGMPDRGLNVLRGFVGVCEYTVINGGEVDEGQLKALDLALKLAEALNMGARRAMGFGHIKYVPVRNR